MYISNSRERLSLIKDHLKVAMLALDQAQKSVHYNASDEEIIRHESIIRYHLDEANKMLTR